MAPVTMAAAVAGTWREWIAAVVVVLHFSLKVLQPKKVGFVCLVECVFDDGSGSLGRSSFLFLSCPSSFIDCATSMLLLLPATLSEMV